MGLKIRCPESHTSVLLTKCVKHSLRLFKKRPPHTKLSEKCLVTGVGLLQSHHCLCRGFSLKCKKHRRWLRCGVCCTPADRCSHVKREQPLTRRRKRAPLGGAATDTAPADLLTARLEFRRTNERGCCVCGQWGVLHNNGWVRRGRGHLLLCRQEGV